MSEVYDTVAVAYVLGLPLLVFFLGVTAIKRDRLVGGVLLAVFAGSAVAVNVALPEPVLTETGIRMYPRFLLIGPVSALGLGSLLYRDRRRRHVRTTTESLLVLGIGMILLAALLSMPVLVADALSPGA